MGHFSRPIVTPAFWQIGKGFISKPVK